VLLLLKLGHIENLSHLRVKVSDLLENTLEEKLVNQQQKHRNKDV